MKMYLIKSNFMGETLTTSYDFFKDVLTNCLYEDFYCEAETEKEEEEAFETELNNLLEKINNSEIVNVDSVKFSIVSKSLVLKEDK